MERFESNFYSFCRCVVREIEARMTPEEKAQTTAEKVLAARYGTWDVWKVFGVQLCGYDMHEWLLGKMEEMAEPLVVEALELFRANGSGKFC